MGAVRAQITERQRARGAPASPRPRGARGAPPGLAASSPGRPVVAPSRAGRRGRGPQRREHLQNKDSGLDRETTPPPPPSLPPPPPRAPARPTRTRLSRTPPERRSRGSTRAHKPSGAPGHHWARRPGAGGGDIAIQSSLPHQTHPHPEVPPHSCFFIIFQAAGTVIFTLGRGPRGAHVGSRWGRGEGAAGLCCKSLSFCGCCAHSPPTAPLHPSVFFFFFLSFGSAVAMGYQGGCHGLPDGGRLARYLPPSRRRSRRRRSARAGGGGSARVRDAARGSVREPPRRRSQQAAEGAAAGAPPPVGWGQSYKEDPEVRN